MPRYEERELTAPVDLCSGPGRLNRDAVGFSRFPLHRCNVTGRFLRKKKWNYWCVCATDFAFSFGIANVDYFGTSFIYIADFRNNSCEEMNTVVPFGTGFEMPETVEETVSYHHKKLNIDIVYNSATSITAKITAPSFKGRRLDAEFDITIPDNHETLNVVIPWSDTLFQFTSKQNTMPTKGFVQFGDDRYEFGAPDAFAILDYGRGIWPYETKWNWASGSAWQGGDLVGLQFGALWTDGTGMNENGIMLNSKLYKIHEDMVIRYDTSNYMKPWTLKTECSDMVDLVLTPRMEKSQKINAGIIAAEGHQMFGSYSGIIRVAGREIKIENIPGWAEQHVSKW